MRRVDELLTVTDARGRRHPPWPLSLKIAETVVRSLLVVGVLVLVGLAWEALA